MGLLDGFNKLVGNAVQGTENALGNGVNTVARNLTGHALFGGAPMHVQNPQQVVAQPSDYAQKMPYLQPNGQPIAHQYNGIGGAPANPDNPQASAPIPSFIGNQYARNPLAPQFRGVDPSIFGYGADDTAQPNFGNSPYNPVTGGGAPRPQPLSLDELLPSYTYNLPQGRSPQPPKELLNKINNASGFNPYQ